MQKITKLDKEIALKVKIIRENLKLSATDLSAHLNVSSSFVRNVEAGYKKYNIKHLYAIYCIFYELDNTVTFDIFIPSYNLDLMLELINTKKVKNKYIKDDEWKRGTPKLTKNISNVI